MVAILFAAVLFATRIPSFINALYSLSLLYPLYAHLGRRDGIHDNFLTF